MLYKITKKIKFNENYLSFGACSYIEKFKS